MEILNAKEICKDDISAYIGHEDDNIYISLSGRYLEPGHHFESLQNEDSAWIKAFPHFNRIIQSLFFVKKLYDNGLILILKGGDDKLGGVDDDITKSIPHFLKHNSLLHFLEKSCYSEIIPTSELITLCNNNFKDAEQIRYENQVQISFAALKRAKRSNYIAISIGLLTLITSAILTKCVNTTINEGQHKELIETIKNHHNGETENAKS